jgi:hypothetical protein
MADTVLLFIMQLALLEFCCLTSHCCLPSGVQAQVEAAAAAAAAAAASTPSDTLLTYTVLYLVC